MMMLHSLKQGVFHFFYISVPEMKMAISGNISRSCITIYLEQFDFFLSVLRLADGLQSRFLKRKLGSQEIDHMTISRLIPKTELPIFSLYHAELSSDNTDIMLCCTAEWPMCLPGVRVEIKEKDSPQVTVCHFSIDWMTAQMKITLSDCDGDVLLSYENTQPFRMGVSCMVTEGSPKDGDRMASQVADTLQMTLMELSLDRVPISMATGQPPTTITTTTTSASVPRVLVSSVDEESPSSDRGDGNHPTEHIETTPTCNNGVNKEVRSVGVEEEKEQEIVKEKEEEEEEEKEKEEEHEAIPQAVAESAVSSGEHGGDTPPSVSKRNGQRNHIMEDDHDEGKGDESSASSHSLIAPPTASTDLTSGNSTAAMKTKSDHHLVNGTGDIPLLPPPQGLRGNGQGSHGNRQGSQGNGQGSRSNGQGSRSNGQGSRSNSLGSQGKGQGSRSNSLGSQGNGQGSRSNGQGSRSNGQGSRSNSLGSQGNGQIRITDVDITPPSPDSTPQLQSPRWRRTPSYEQLEEISLEASPPGNLKEQQLKQRSSSTDHLASPAYVSSPMGKKSLTLSIAGSEAESIYGADERIPSMLVFEIEEVGGRVRHFVAMSTSHAIKMRQRYKTAKKLHIYNNHLFTASKLTNKSECVVCKEKLNKLFGKKGYKCRCCEMIVHKQCHCKVEEMCESSDVNSMKLIYPEDRAISSSVALSP